MIVHYIKIQSHSLRVPAKTLKKLVSIAHFLSYQSQLATPPPKKKPPKHTKIPQTQYLPQPSHKTKGKRGVLPQS